MISLKELYRTYNLKTWKENKFQIFLSIFSISIAVAILISLRLILSLDTTYKTINARSLNDGDINIVMSNANISDQQLEVLNTLKKEDKIDYATTYKIENNFTSFDITSAVELKFIDSGYNLINKKLGNAADNLGKNNVLINKVLADKFNLKRGSTISLVIKGFSDNATSFKVEDIIENTNVIDESVLGVIILDKSNLQGNGNINIETIVNNISLDINPKYKLEDIKSQLDKSFNNSAKISTYQDFLKDSQKEVDTENKALEFIEILVIIITGAGISVNTSLLTLKRRKDYVLFRIYGMKEPLLRDLILYETSIICIIGNIIGLFFSLIITFSIEKNIISEIGIPNLIIAAIVPIASTIIFIIVQTLIFTILPITMSKEIEPNSILRQENHKFNIDNSNTSSIFKIIFLLSISFSIYIGSLQTGCMYVCIILIYIIILFGITFGVITLIAKMEQAKNKFLMLALRNLRRQKNKFTLCSTALVGTLVLCGIVINLGYSIIPNVLSQSANTGGYTLSLNTVNTEENLNKTEKVLKGEHSIQNYIKTIKTTAKIQLVNGKNLEELVNAKHYDDTFKKNILTAYNNVPIEAMDISKDMITYNTALGRWFNKADVNKNYIVLGNNFESSCINIGDEVSFDIQGHNFKFLVIGICTRDNVNDNQGVYIGINSLKDINLINDSNSKLNYLIKCDTKNENQLTINLTKKLKDSLIINVRILYDQLGKYIQQLSYVFIYICFISVFSAVCLIGNLLMMINYERLKEFLVLNVLGAKNRDIRKITIMEGFIIGGVSGILGSLMSEFTSFIIITNLFQCKYSPNCLLDLIMIFAAIILTISSSLLVINNMKLQKYTELLRED